MEDIFWLLYLWSYAEPLFSLHKSSWITDEYKKGLFDLSG